MKILTPFPLTSDQVASNAPVEQFAEWDYVGRNNLSSVQEPLLYAYEDTLYYATTTGGINDDQDIGVQDLVSGQELDPVASVLGIPSALAVSPNGQWVACLFESSTGPTGYRVQVFDTSTLQQVYGDYAASNGTGSMAWSADSARLAYAYSETEENGFDMCARIISSSSWSSPAQTETVSDLAGHTGVQGETLDALDWDTSGNLFLTGVSIESFFSGPYSCRLAKFSASGATLENIEIATTAFNHRMIVNRSRGEVLVLASSSNRLYAASNLASLSLPPALGFKANLVERSLNDAEIFLLAASGIPKERRFNAADYNELPAFPIPVEEIAAYSDSYFLGSASAGYRIVDRGTNEEIELSNPQILEGDTYIYNERVYESLVDNQSRPDIGAALEVPEWVDLGPINPLRMFDGSINSTTTADTDLVVQVNVNEVVRAVGLFNVSATTVQIQMLDQGGAEVYDSGELDLVGNDDIQDLNAYFFDGITLSPDFVFTALPPYLNATVIVTLKALGDGASVGEMVLGTTHELGDTEYGTGVGILDFSRKERDEFGNFKVVERQFSKRANYDVSIPTSLVSSVQQRLAKYRSIPVVFIGAEARPETVVYGFYRSFDIVLDGPKFSSCSIEVEGLT